MAAARGAAKQAMCLLQAGHLGKVRSLETNDAFVGMLGVLTSASDLRGMWPKAAAKQGKVKFA